VKVLVVFEVPKSVQSAVDGVVSPLTIEVALPCTSISGYYMVATIAVLGVEAQIPFTAST